MSQPYPEEGIGKFSAGGAPTPSLRAALEALLLVVDEPVAEVTLAQVLERPRTEVAAALAALATEYAESDRGFELRAVAGGWRLYTRPDLAPYVERFVLDGQQARLSQPALETLAVIAYRQPVRPHRRPAAAGAGPGRVRLAPRLRGDHRRRPGDRGRSADHRPGRPGRPGSRGRIRGRAAGRHRAGGGPPGAEQAARGAERDVGRPRPAHGRRPGRGPGRAAVPRRPAGCRQRRPAC